MRFKTDIWTIDKIQAQRSAIDPDPPFQRGEVWKLPAQQLLIDSIFCGFDIPKIYLKDRGTNVLFKYSIADGQQRLLSIMGFIDDKFSCSSTSYSTTPFWAGKRFSDLTKKQQQKFLSYSLVVSIAADAEPDEIRELFWRLQQGSSLNPPEKRNCMPSQLGDEIRRMAEAHRFFTNKSAYFSSDRRGRDNICAHAFALQIYGSSCDLKAPMLKNLYEEYADGIATSVVQAVNKTLNFLAEVNQADAKIIRTKWGFVDLYLLIKDIEDGERPDAEEFAGKYADFEARRQKFNASPEPLIENSPSTKADRLLYDYIIAFRTSGGLAKNVRKRQTAISKLLMDR